MKDVIRLYGGSQAQGKLDVPVTSITTRSTFDSCRRKTLVTTVWTAILILIESELISKKFGSIT